MNQKTLCLLKPDIVRRSLIGEAITELEQDFKITKIELKSLTTNQTEEFYAEHKSKPFFNQLVGFMIKGPIVVLILESENAITKLRNLMGHFDPNLAQEGTLRRKFGISMDENSFHGSDSESSAEREINIIFNEK